MKKFTLTLILIVACIVAEAKVVKIKLADGSMKVFTSSQLSTIDFNDDGTLTVTTYDGVELPALDATFEELEIGNRPVVTDIYPDTLSFNINADGVPVDIHCVRPIIKMNYVYPSTDPWGEPVTLSGTILFPEEVWNGTVKSEGILMVNHYTKFHRNEAPTIVNGELESMFLANPLEPNYIIVESDFYGFGVSERFPQAFLQGLVNARSSLDGLLAARQLLDERGFAYGPLCFNMGYSSGGFDALAAQKLRDMEYADRISFDKTFAGGSPSDVRETYRQYVQIDSTAYNAVPLLLLVTTNEIQGLNIDYADVFQPYICNRIDELVLSKNYSSWPVCDSIGRERKIHEILTPAYCDLETDESKAMQELLAGFNLNKDDEWTPDATQRIFLFHSRGDDYVPLKGARPMVGFLKSKGLTPSIIPGRTNFQTNFVVRNMGHLSATLVYFIQSLAAIKAWPLMYTDNELNPVYAAIVNDNLDPVTTMRLLDAMGFDCRKVINNIINILATQAGNGEVNMISLMAIVTQALQMTDLTVEEVYEMSEDSGLDITSFFLNLAQDLQENLETAEVAGEDKGYNLFKAFNHITTTPELEYEQQLSEWLDLK